MPSFSLLRVVPWAVLLKQAPAIIAAADRLLAASRARQHNPPSAGGVEALHQRLRAVEEEHQHTLVVVKQLADQMAALSSAAHAAEARMRLLQIVAWAAGAVALAALGLALVR